MPTRCALSVVPREWNTPRREPWNPVICQLLRAVDHHNVQFFRSGDRWHLEKADQLRRYVRELKDWLTAEEDHSDWSG